MQLLATLRKARLHNTKKAFSLLRGEWYLRLHLYTHNSGVNLRCRIKRTRGNVCNNLWLPIELNAHPQQTEIARASDNTLRDFVLHHHYQQSGGIGTFQKVAEGRGRNIVWQVCHQFVWSLAEKLC